MKFKILFLFFIEINIEGCCCTQIGIGINRFPRIVLLSTLLFKLSILYVREVETHLNRVIRLKRSPFLIINSEVDFCNLLAFKPYEIFCCIELLRATILIIEIERSFLPYTPLEVYCRRGKIS